MCKLLMCILTENNKETQYLCFATFHRTEPNEIAVFDQYPIYSAKELELDHLKNLNVDTIGYGQGMLGYSLL